MHRRTRIVTTLALAMTLSAAPVAVTGAYAATGRGDTDVVSYSAPPWTCVILPFACRD